MSEVVDNILKRFEHMKLEDLQHIQETRLNNRNKEQERFDAITKGIDKLIQEKSSGTPRESIVVRSIPLNELKDYEHYIGFLFKTANGSYNICDSEEDIIKTNQWTNNLPLNSIVVNDAPIEVGDKILAICENPEMNGKTFTYHGDHTEGVGLVRLTKGDEETITTKHILDGAYKVVRVATREDKERIVNGKITPVVKY